MGVPALVAFVATYVADYLADLSLDSLKKHQTDTVNNPDYTSGSVTTQFDEESSVKQKVSEDLKVVKSKNKKKVRDKGSDILSAYSTESDSSDSPLIKSLLFGSAGVGVTLVGINEALQGIEDSLELLTSSVVANGDRTLTFQYDDLAIRALQMFELTEAIKSLGAGSNPLTTSDNLPKLLTALESVGALNSTLQDKLTSLATTGIKEAITSGFNGVADNISNIESFDSTALVTAVNNIDNSIDLTPFVNAVSNISPTVNIDNSIDFSPLVAAVGGVATAITDKTMDITLENLNFELAPELATVLAGIGVGLGAVGSGLTSVSGSLSSTLSLSSPNSLTTQIKRKIDTPDDCECADSLAKISDNLENMSDYFGFFIGDSAPSDSSAPAYSVANYFQEFSKTAKDLNDFDLDDISDFLYKSSNLSIDDMEVKDV